MRNYYTRFKGYVIVRHNGKYIVFRHAESKQITPAGGGCQKENGYNKRNCARRELREESKGALNLRRTNLRNAFNFVSNVRFPGENTQTKKGQKILQHYYVFTANVNRPSFSKIKQRFNNSKNTNKEMNQIHLVNLNNNRVPWWPFIKTHVINKYTKKGVSSPRRSPSLPRTYIPPHRR